VVGKRDFGSRGDGKSSLHCHSNKLLPFLLLCLLASVPLTVRKSQHLCFTGKGFGNMAFPFPALKMTPNWFLTHFMQLFWNLENPTDTLYKAPYIYEHLGTWPVVQSSNFLLIGRNSFTACVPKVNYFLLKPLTCVLAQFSAWVRTRNGTKGSAPPLQRDTSLPAVKVFPPRAGGRWGGGWPAGPCSPAPLLYHAAQLRHALDWRYSQPVC